MAPEEQAQPTGGSTTCRLRLANEPPSAAVESGDPLKAAAFDPDALARRDTKAWQDALIVATPAQRPGGGDPGHLMLLLLLTLVLWLERPVSTTVAPLPQAPLASANESADVQVTPEDDLVLARRRLDADQAEAVLLSAAPRKSAPGWTEPFAAGAFLALAAAVFTLLRTQVPASLALLASIACIVQVSARPPEWAAAALAVGTVGFAVVAARGATGPWKTGAIVGLVLITSMTTPAVGAALLGAWAFEAALARQSHAAAVRGAAAFAPLVLAGAGVPAWGVGAAPGGAEPEPTLGALLLLLAVPGAGVLCARGAWLVALAPVLLLASSGGAVEPALITPFVALAAATAVDAAGRAVLARVAPARHGADALAAQVRGPRPAPVM